MYANVNNMMVLEIDSSVPTSPTQKKDGKKEERKDNVTWIVSDLDISSIQVVIDTRWQTDGVLHCTEVLALSSKFTVQLWCFRWRQKDDGGDST